PGSVGRSHGTSLVVISVGRNRGALVGSRLVSTWSDARASRTAARRAPTTGRSARGAAAAQRAGADRPAGRAGADRPARRAGSDRPAQRARAGAISTRSASRPAARGAPVSDPAGAVGT